MRFIFCYSISILIISSLVACGGGQSHETAEGHDDNYEHEGHKHAEKDAGDGCVLVYDEDSTKLSWTAYKTIDKVGVSGSFELFKMGGVKEGKTSAEVFENVRFKISSASVNSNNPDRDKKVSEHFFGTMARTLHITGIVDRIEENHAVVLIDMNGISRKQKFDLKTDDATYCSIMANLNLENWNAIESVDALNEVCFDLHKGADGESKLWSEVKVELSVQLVKKCP